MLRFFLENKNVCPPPPRKAGSNYSTQINNLVAGYILLWWYRSYDIGTAIQKLRVRVPHDADK